MFFLSNEPNFLALFLYCRLLSYPSWFNSVGIEVLVYMLYKTLFESSRYLWISVAETPDRVYCSNPPFGYCHICALYSIFYFNILIASF